MTCNCAICNGTIEPPDPNDALELGYKNYVELCKESNIEPMDFDDWYDTLL